MIADEIKLWSISAYLKNTCIRYYIIRIVLKMSDLREDSEGKAKCQPHAYVIRTSIVAKISVS